MVQGEDNAVESSMEQALNAKNGCVRDHGENQDRT